MVIDIKQPEIYDENEFFIVFDKRISEQTDINLSSAKSILVETGYRKYSYFVTVDDETIAILKMLIA